MNLDKMIFYLENFKIFIEILISVNLNFIEFLKKIVIFYKNHFVFDVFNLSNVPSFNDMSTHLFDKCQSFMTNKHPKWNFFFY